jgi:hypothetical protein
VKGGDLHVKFKNLGITGSVIAAMLVFGGTLVAAPAASNTKPAQQSREAAKLLKDIRMDAREVAKHAQRFETLSTKSTAKWQAFDTQWNEIKPSVEDMSMKLSRLQKMEASLPEGQQKAIENSEPLVRNIAGDTHDLYQLVDQGMTNLPRKQFKQESGELANAAHKLAQVTQSPKQA